MGRREASRASTSVLDWFAALVSCHGAGREGSFPHVQPEGRAEARHRGKPGISPSCRLTTPRCVVHSLWTSPGRRLET